MHVNDYTHNHYYMHNYRLYACEIFSCVKCLCNRLLDVVPSSVKSAKMLFIAVFFTSFFMVSHKISKTDIHMKISELE